MFSLGFQGAAYPTLGPSGSCLLYTSSCYLQQAQADGAPHIDRRMSPADEQVSANNGYYYLNNGKYMNLSLIHICRNSIVRHGPSDVSGP